MFGNPEGKINLGYLHLEENITIKQILKNVVCEDMDWIHLAEESV
jgi:hypothetical protein